MFDYQNEKLPEPLRGEYDNPPDGCPNCGRQRVMLCQDKKHHCEKCWWCVEDKKYDGSWWDREGKVVWNA